MKFILFMLLMVSFGCKADEIRVAAAANFYHTLNKIVDRFEAETEHKVTIIRGSTGKLYAQIINGAPYDLFLSADSVRAEKLVIKKRAEPDDISIYAIGQLVLWKPDSDSSQMLREQLYSGEFKKLAIANPKTAPYGGAAIEALKSLEIYAEVKSKLVYAENIAQALQYVQSGAADLGLLARSHVNDDIYWQVDTYFHKPIQQKMLVLKNSKNLDLSRQFFNFIKSPEIKKLIENDGYTL